MTGSGHRPRFVRSPSRVAALVVAVALTAMVSACSSATAGAGWTSVPFLPLLRQPTLIMSGDDDPIIPLVNARLMHRLIPHSQLHIFHGGHLGLVTEAPQLAPVVDCFLGGLHDNGSGR